MFFFSSRRRHTRLQGDWSSDVCSSDLLERVGGDALRQGHRLPRRGSRELHGRLQQGVQPGHRADEGRARRQLLRSEEHTSELQSPCNIVCRLLLEKKKSTRTSSSEVIQ